jgi:regulatory protein YycI of two-component signal transduction system YycFG
MNKWYVTDFFIILIVLIVNFFIYNWYFNKKITAMQQEVKGTMSTFRLKTESDFNKKLQENNSKYNQIYGFIQANWDRSPEELEKLLKK